jgi:hypothetical protein
VIIVAADNLDFRVLGYQILSAITFSAITVFGLVAGRLRHSWALIVAAAGSIGLLLRLFAVSDTPVPDDLYLTASLAWQVLLLVAGILMYRDNST